MAAQTIVLQNFHILRRDKNRLMKILQGEGGIAQLFCHSTQAVGGGVVDVLGGEAFLCALFLDLEEELTGLPGRLVDKGDPLQHLVVAGIFFG